VYTRRPVTLRGDTRFDVRSSDTSNSAAGSPGPEQEATLQRPEKTRLRASLAPPRAEAAPSIEAGTTIQRRYVLEEMIGSGAMGQVWRARDLIREQARNSRSRVAVKLLNAECSQHPDAFIGLEREASKAQELAHPNIITVHTFDYDVNLGCAFIVMEYLEGCSLEATIRRTRDAGGMARAEALPIIAGVLDGLAYAHRKGVVHCDLKPANIFLSTDGSAKILDFGIAQAVRREGGKAGSEGAEDPQGFRGYTPRYASAQLAHGEDPLPADDVFALGIVLYELLSGRYPFARETPGDARAAARPVAPLAGLKQAEWRAIRRALATERSERWDDAEAMRQAFRGRSRVALTLAAVAAVFAVVAAAAGYQDWRAAQPDVPLARLPAGARAAFQREIAQADRAWQLLQSGQSFVFEDALDGYENAFRIHPRDHAAVDGLERIADYAIRRAESSSDPGASLAVLQSLEQRSPFLRGYPPLQRAIAREQSRVKGG